MKREVRSTSFSIRRAKKNDAAAVADLLTQLGYPTSAKEMSKRFMSILADRNFGTFVAVSDGRICGMIGLNICRSYEHNDRGGRILGLVIDRSFRRLGIARNLIERAEEFFRENKINRVAVNTHVKRKDAHKFYAALGFTRNGFRFVKELSSRRASRNQARD
jgi:GNAT superfamily N-acetyltransferase